MTRWQNVIRALPLGALLAATAAAQPPHAGPGGGQPPFPPPAFVRAPFEARVEGLPYRAVSVVEFAADPGDGSLHARRTTGVVARDAAGRTRREDAMGPEEKHVVAIDDPVAGVRYVLFPERAEGRKLVAPPGAGPGGMGARRRGPGGAEGPPAVTSEALGTEVIAGVEAEGTRDTITVPAGAHGNESPVEVVSERWYSAELKALVRQRHRDPRGERTWTLTEITRGEPDASLFEVPAGYAIEEGKR